LNFFTLLPFFFHSPLSFFIWIVILDIRHTEKRRRLSDQGLSCVPEDFGVRRRLGVR
jgi:hypothetical protein